MTHWRLFLLPEGPFFERQFITKEAVVLFIRDNLFFCSNIKKPYNKDFLIAAPDMVSFIPEEYTEIEKCLLEIVEVE
jgi:hypothetical protein